MIKHPSLYLTHLLIFVFSHPTLQSRQGYWIKTKTYLCYRRVFSSERWQTSRATLLCFKKTGLHLFSSLLRTSVFIVWQSRFLVLCFLMKWKRLTIGGLMVVFGDLSKTNRATFSCAVAGERMIMAIYQSQHNTSLCSTFTTGKIQWKWFFTLGHWLEKGEEIIF